MLAEGNYSAILAPIWIIHDAVVSTVALDMVQKLGSRQNAEFRTICQDHFKMGLRDFLVRIERGLPTVLLP